MKFCKNICIFNVLLMEVHNVYTLRFRINVVPCLLILEGFSHHHAPYSDHHDYYFEPFLNQ